MRRLMLLAPLALLAACDSGPEVDVSNATVEEVAEQVRDADGGVGTGDGFVRPGLWSTRVTLAEFDMPGMPAQVRDQMQASMARNADHQTCLTPEEVRKPREDFFAGDNKNCRYDHFRMGDGRIDARMRCAADGMSQQMEMTGTYGPESYTMSMTTRAEAEDSPMGAMTMKMDVESKRIGDCDKAAAQG